jgi:hypothetical protein
MSTTTTTTTTLNCESINIMDIIVSKAKELVDSGTSPGYQSALYTILDQGIVLPITGGCNINIISLPQSFNYFPTTQICENTCCTDCNVYYLTDINNFNQYGSSMISFSNPCCVNTFMGIERNVLFQQYLSAENITLPETCCNNFQECVEDIITIPYSDCYDCQGKSGYEKQIDLLLDAGIIEIGTINGRSILCDYLQALLDNEIDLIGDCSAIDYLISLLNSGVAIWCEETCNLATEDNELILTENSENIQPELCPEETTTTTTTTI